MEKSKNQRVFDLSLKMSLVREIERGKVRVCDVTRIYQVSPSAVYKWLQKYSQLYGNNQRVIVESKSLSKKTKEQADRIKELERALGQKQMKIDYLEKLVEAASSRLGEDIEKKIKRLL
jgi:transposase